MQICHSFCNNLACGYAVGLAGEKFYGNYTSYRGRSDTKPIQVPSGQSEGSHIIQFSSPIEQGTLYFSVDEQPDFSMTVDVLDGSLKSMRHWEGDANEKFKYDLSAGLYYLKLATKLSRPGKGTANYDPVLYVLPKRQDDTAGNSKSTARDAGEIQMNGMLAIPEYIQRTLLRNDLGVAGTQTDINDTADFYRVHIPTKGKLTARLKTWPDADPTGVRLEVRRLDSDQGPDNGWSVPAGDFYLKVTSANDSGVGKNEFSFRYNLELSLTP